MDIDKSATAVSPTRVPPDQPMRMNRLRRAGRSKAEILVKTDPEGAKGKHSVSSNPGMGMGNDPEMPHKAVNTVHSQSLSDSSGTLIHDSEVPVPFWEDDYPSQRFRPEAYEEENRGYSPPPQLFSPPVSPNEVGDQESTLVSEPSANPEQMASSSRDPYEGMTSTPAVPAHNGFEGNPWLISYPNLHEAFADLSQFTDAAHGGVHTVMTPIVGQGTNEETPSSNAGQKPAASDFTSKDVSSPTVQHESSFSSEAENHPKSSVRWDESDMSMPDTHRTQTKTFQQLAAENGIREWNNNVPDERWLEPSESSTAPIGEPQQPAEKKELSAKMIELMSRRHKRLESFLKELDDTETKMDSRIGTFQPDPSIWGLENTSSQYTRAFRGQQPTNELVPEPPEPERLQQVIRDLEGGTEALPRGITHHPDVLRRYFYDRVFQGQWDGQLQNPQGDNMTKHNGRFISLKALRDQVLKDIEDLIDYLKVPVAEGTRSAMYHRTPEAKAAAEAEAFGGHSDVKEPFVPQYLPGISSRGYRYSVREEQHSPPLEKTCEAKGGETHRGKTPTKKPTPRNIFSRDQGFSRPAYQPFSEQLRAIESRQPFLEQLRAIEARADCRARRGSLSGEISHQNKVKDISAKHETSKASSFNDQHNNLPNTATSQHDASTLTPRASSKQNDMEGLGIKIPQEPMGAEERQAIVDARVEDLRRQHAQRGHQAFGHQLPTHYHQLYSGTAPPSGLSSAESRDPWAASAPAPEENFDPWTSDPVPLWGREYPQQPAVDLSGNYIGSSQPMQYRSQPRYIGFVPQPINYTRLSDGPPPPSVWVTERMPSSNYGQQRTYPPLDQGPPPPARPFANVATRPPSSNRVAAQVYRNDPAFNYSGLPQVRGTPVSVTPQGYATPASFASQGRATPSVTAQSQNELLNRFGIVPSAKPEVPIMPYRPGSDDMRPHATAGAHSVPYQNLTRNTLPSLEQAEAPENFPFAELAKEAKPPEWGVLKIGNIPYDITKPLVVSFLGPHAKTISPSFGPAIHIIMDRNSGKTMDCYVEFLSTPDARATCNSINLRQHGLNRISDRMVDVTMSSQDELLAVLFPKAKNVEWKNGSPVIKEAEDEWSSGFKSFVSAEELGLLVKHAEQPHRSNFTLRSPQRPYEAMISLLAKYPWHSVFNYKLSHRNAIFNALRQMLQILTINIRKERNQGRAEALTLYGSPVKYGNGGRVRGSFSYGGGMMGGGGGPPVLNEQLLHDLLSAGLNATGFSERQRWELYEMCDYGRHHFLVSPLLQFWPFEVLGRKPRVEEDVLELYAQLIGNNREVIYTGHPFGSMAELTRNIDMEGNTMASIGALETKMLEALLIGGLDNARDEQAMREGVEALTYGGEEEH